MITFPYKKYNPFVQFDWHDGIFLQPPPIIPITGSALHIAAGVLAMPWWWLGKKLSNEDKLLADGMPIVSEGHQPAHLLLPHINVWPFVPVQLNLMIGFLILDSTNTCAMSASSVVGRDGPIAISIFRYVGLNQGCTDAGAQTKIASKTISDIPKGIPTAFALIPNSLVVNWGTVHVGFTLGDLVRFIAKTLLGFAVQKIFDRYLKKLQDLFTIKIRPKIEDLLPNSMMKNAFKNILRKLGGPLVGRAGDGKFMSISEAMADKTHTLIDKYVLNKALDEIGFPKDFRVIDFEAPLTDAAAATTDHLSKWADGKAELLP